MHDAPTGTQPAAAFSIWGIEFKKVLPAIVIGVTTSVISQLILDEVRASRQAGRESKRVMA